MDLHTKLRDLVQDAVVREALALASPDLSSRLRAWLEGGLDRAAARGVEQSLLKYVSRMSHRPTPFGLFAGVSMGCWGGSSHLVLEPWAASHKALRLDWGLLEVLVQRLEGDPKVRSGLAYRPNTSLHACGGWYRYLECGNADGQGRTFRLAAVEATSHLDFAIHEAQEGILLEELGRRLARHAGVELADAAAFLDQVVEAQVLVGDLHPPLTGPDPLSHVVARLHAHPVTAPLAALLAGLEGDLAALRRAPLGTFPEGYPAHLATLAHLEVDPARRDVLQVDLHRPAPCLALGPRVRRILEAGADLLRHLTPPREEGPLDRFRMAFTSRYEARWMPLLEVLDEENGIGFDGAPPLEGSLLEALPLRPPVPRGGLSPRDHFLLSQLSRWQGSLVWELDEADLESLVNPDPPAFPPSFAALACLAAPDSEALDRGDFQFWMEQYSGPTAARWLGRFAAGDRDLETALQRHLRKEEASCPKAVFAEVVHVPEGRMGNVLARPVLRDHEIPFLASPGVPVDRTIPPSDLQVTVRNGRVWLASTRLGREVIPRLSSAHNFKRGPAVYRFLAHLQDQDGPSGGWSWGALSDQPFLPRVVHGRQVLSKARWRVEAKELKTALADSKEGIWGAFQLLRSRRGLPRFLTLTDADNGLWVDLDQALWVETLGHLVSHRPAFLLGECFPGHDQALVVAPEGRFAHELIIPFEGVPTIRPAPPPFPTGGPVSPVRAYPPGSEWLYLKLYCGLASADRLLVELDPLLQDARAEGLWDRWHFVRYRDPDPHLRLRIHGHPGRLLTDLLPRIHRHLEKDLAHGLLWKWQVDTFEPEWERYGGPHGFALAEAWFHDDSRQVLDHLVSGLAPEDRWRMGLREADGIWAALGLDVPARKRLAQATRDRFRKEFGDSREGVIHLGEKFRSLRGDLEGGFPHPSAPLGPIGPQSLIRIREALEQGALPEEADTLAGSLVHMHLNRLFRANPREHEWALMEFLTRLYESHLARAMGHRKSVGD